MAMFTVLIFTGIKMPPRVVVPPRAEAARFPYSRIIIMNKFIPGFPSLFIELMQQVYLGRK